MNIETIVLMWFAGHFIVAGIVWGAIRADIKSIHKSIALLQELNIAQTERIDNLLLGLHSSYK